ncbi:MAG: hypothetical protein JSS49_15335 [Planctomycetes bacterium]|nr:hypothetical protein [Planctomycetota bacterium]
MTVVETPQSRCLAAVARCDITPPVGIYHRMWGAATHDRSTGVHRPLTATALVLRGSGSGAMKMDQQHVVLAVDHCLLWTTEMAALLNSVSQATGISQDQLTVFFSHTHGAGLMGLERRELPGGDLIPPYLEALAANLARLVREALEQLKPATIVYGYGHSDLATNRDFLDEERGHSVCGFNPTGIADDTVLVARITSDTHQTLATVVNYACHPTTLAWENTLISPDYIGAMREVVETATSTPCLFIQGASGDIGPREGFVGDVRVADRNGRRLGYAALAALEALPSPGTCFAYVKPVVSGATLGVWEHRPESSERIALRSGWRSRRIIVPIAYRQDLPVRAELEQDLVHWHSVEEQARTTGRPIQARDARAMIERANRRLTRVASLPQGTTYPYPIVAWQIGDAIWLALDGEHYNVLQRVLRERFPNIALVIGTIANGSNVWYLPDESSYGKGLYQEEVSILQQGCLEQVIQAATELIQELASPPNPPSPLH